jgi:hypothetical protein
MYGMLHSACKSAAWTFQVEKSFGGTDNPAMIEIVGRHDEKKYRKGQPNGQP